MKIRVQRREDSAVETLSLVPPVEIHEGACLAYFHCGDGTDHYFTVEDGYYDGWGRGVNASPEEAIEEIARVEADREIEPSGEPQLSHEEFDGIMQGMADAAAGRTVPIEYIREMCAIRSRNTALIASLDKLEAETNEIAMLEELEAKATSFAHNKNLTPTHREQCKNESAILKRILQRFRALHSLLEEYTKGALTKNAASK